MICYRYVKKINVYEVKQQNIPALKWLQYIPLYVDNLCLINTY